jgi:hypothetical protein
MSVMSTLPAIKGNLGELGRPFLARYRDHVAFRGADPDLMAPQTRECVGWLVYDGPDYITLVFDRNADPPTLKGGDPKAGGLTIWRCDLVKLEALR